VRKEKGSRGEVASWMLGRWAPLTKTLCHVTFYAIVTTPGPMLEHINGRHGRRN